MIVFTAHLRHASCRTDPCDRITTGSVGIPVRFAFSAEWDGLGKTAVFRGSGKSIDVLLTGDECCVPPEVLTQPGDVLSIGVYGTDGSGELAIPTVYADAGRIHRGAEPSGIEPTPHTQSLVDQILAAAQAAQDAAEDAQEAAQSVRDDADAGAFDGKPGAPGPRGPAGDDYILTDADKAEIARDTAEIMLEPRTATGDTLEITDGVGGVRALSLVASIEPSQSGSGDPSQENVRPISGLTAVTVSRSQDGGSWTAQLGRTVYGGSLDLVSGVLTIDRSAEALSWSLRNAGGDVPWIRMEGSFPEISVETRAKWLCSKARTLANSGSSLPSERVGIIWQYDESTARIYLEPGATLADAQAFMEDVQIVHPLAEPIFVQLTPQEIAMLEGANTFSGTGGGLTLVYPARPSGGSGGVTVDDEISGSSTNPVQNKVIKAALDEKANTSSIPTKTSDLQNDSGYLTQHQSLAAYRTAAAQDVIDQQIAGAIPTKTSDLQNDSGYLTQHQSLAAYRTAADQDLIDAGKADKVQEVTVATDGALSQAVEPGKAYHFTGDLTALSITAATPGEGHYHLDFVSGATAPTVTLPGAWIMPDGWTVEANTRYEIDVLDGYAVAQGWEVTS